MGIRKGLVIILIVAVALVSLSCIVSSDSPAPGCVEHIGCAPMGGCFGKTVIQDLEVTGPDCLIVAVNNCNGGVLEMTNNCSESFLLGNEEVPPAGSASFDLRQTSDGVIELIEISSNFSDFIPESNQFIEMSGKLGDISVEISFIKTAPLCK
jgi:hypothetical protein